MGCDIHLFIEVKRKSSKHWFGFGGQFQLTRNYWMFGILAKGVRTEPAHSYEPRQIPIDSASGAVEELMLYINDENPEHKYETTENAMERELKSRAFVWRDETGKPTHVSDVDIHHHSWLTMDEYAKAIEWFNEDAKEENFTCPVDYVAVLSAMKTFSEQGYDCRVVFGFDN